MPTPARPLRPTGNPYLGRACDEGSCGLLDPISQVGEWGLVELDGRECLFCKWCSDRISSLHKGSGMPARVAVVLGEGIVHRMRQPVLL